MSSPLAALAVMLALGGCGARGVFADYPVEESPTVAAAPWPRLVDTPDPASIQALDPADGARIVGDLSASAAVAAAEADRLSGPVVDVPLLRAEAQAARAAAGAALAVDP